MINRESRIYSVVSLSVFVILCLALMFHLSYYPSQVERADAWGYINHALELRTDGLFGKLSSWRTYGYVWFLYFCSLVFGTDRSVLSLGAGAVQAVIYAISVYWLAVSVSPAKNWRIAVLVGLLANPILIALVVDTLSESLTLSIAVLLAAIMLNAERARDGDQFKLFAWLALGSSVAAFALMIRPANIPLLIGWHIGALFFIWRGDFKTSVKRASIYLGIFCLTATIIWLPQLIINHRHFHGASILPASSLGKFQILYGIKLLKYATRVDGDMAAGLFYPNPWLSGVVKSGTPWQWYFSHPIAGLGTIISHVFNALNYDHPFVYVYDVTLPYSMPTSFCVWFVYALGTLGIWKLTERWIKSGTIMKDSAITASLASAALMTFATVSLSSVESRFSTLILAVVGVFAVHVALELKTATSSRRMRILGLALIVAVAGTSVSEWMKTLLTTTPVT